MPIPFRKIQFGYASAEVESAEDPRLLVDAFFDTHDVVRRVVHGPNFVILGAKGSGKSAIGFHLSLVAQQRQGLFVTHRALGDLSLQALQQIADEGTESELRFLRAWSWLLLLNLFGSLVLDQGAIPSDQTRFMRTTDILRQRGLLPVRDLSDLASKSTLHNFQLSAWGVELTAGVQPREDRVTTTAAANHLRELLATTRTKSHHLLVIDGLDDVLLDADFQLEALSALVLESSRLNQFFREHNVPFKILVLCRTDIYERLPGSNQNKIRQDLALELNWFVESADPKTAPLVKLIQLRAALADPTLGDIFDTYFPRKLGGSATVRFLLDHTRHTPRDFVQTMRYIQGFSTKDKVLDPSEVRAGLRAYSEKYFLPEIKDELDGVVKRSETEMMMEMLRQFRLPEFDEDEFRAFLNTRMKMDQIDLDRILRALYSAGAIGNIYDSGDGKRRYSFRYRNPGSVYSRSDKVVLHRALRRALQV